MKGYKRYDKNTIRLPRQEQDEKPEPPVISALFKPVPYRFTPHLHQTQPHGVLTKAPGRAGSAGQIWGFLIVNPKGLFDRNLFAFDNNAIL